MSESGAVATGVESQRGNPGLFIALVLLTLVVSAVIIAGFWGDREDANDLTPLQQDIGEVDVGPGASIPQ